MKYLIPVLAGTLLIPIPQFGPASLIEIIWFLVGLAAVIFSLVSMPKVVTDYIIAKNAPSGDAKVARARILLARGHVRREIVRLLQGGIIMGIGLFTLRQPNVATSITVSGLVLTAGLVLLAALVGYQSWFDRVQRNHAEEVLDSE